MDPNTLTAVYLMLSNTGSSTSHVTSGTPHGWEWIAIGVMMQMILMNLGLFFGFTFRQLMITLAALPGLSFA